MLQIMHVYSCLCQKHQLQIGEAKHIVPDFMLVEHLCGWMNKQLLIIIIFT